MVELGKLRIQTEEREKRISHTEFTRKMKSRSGVMETRVVSCTECWEEFCMGETCTEFMYEAFMREDPSAQAATSGQGNTNEKQSKKRKSRKRIKIYLVYLKADLKLKKERKVKVKKEKRAVIEVKVKAEK